MPVRSQRQRFVPRHIGHTQVTVEVREQRATSRFFPAQVAVHGFRRHAKQNEPLFSGKVLCRRFARLRRSREVDVSVRHIDRSAGRAALGFQKRPFVGPKDLVNEHNAVMAPARPHVKFTKMSPVQM